MVHVFFPLFLYLLGVLLLLPAGPRVPARFIGWTAFAWGALAWIVATLLALIAPVPVNPMSVTVALIGILLVHLFWSYQHRNLHWPDITVLNALLGPSGLFIIVVAIPTLLQIVHVLPDSFHILLIAKDVAGGELSGATLTEFGLYGPALPLLHSPASWFGAGFFYSLPAAIAFTLTAALRYFCFEGLRRLGWATRQSARLANLVTLLFVSTLWVFFQFTYFHNGSLAALYLLLGVACLWLSMVSRENSWLWLGTSALLGLALTRVETVFLSVAVLSIALSYRRIAVQEWTRPVFLFSLVELAWYGWLGLVARPETVMLNPQRIPFFAGIVALLPLGVICMHPKSVQNVVRPHLYTFLIAGLGLIVAVLIALFPDRVIQPLWSAVANFFLLGTLWWGVTWWLVVGYFLILMRTDHVVYERLFAGAILSFWALYLMLGIVAGGYTIRADGTASRMGLHILPVIFLYLTLRAAPYLTSPLPEPLPE